MRIRRRRNDDDDYDDNGHRLSMEIEGIFVGNERGTDKRSNVVKLKNRKTKGKEKKKRKEEKWKWWEETE